MLLQPSLVVAEETLEIRCFNRVEETQTGPFGASCLFVLLLTAVQTQQTGQMDPRETRRVRFPRLSVTHRQRLLGNTRRVLPVGIRLDLFRCGVGAMHLGHAGVT